jgi:hypothetical protein
MTLSLHSVLWQVVAAFIRPHPHTALRGAWNAVHHNLGRLVILLVSVEVCQLTQPKPLQGFG